MDLLIFDMIYNPFSSSLSKILPEPILREIPLALEGERLPSLQAS